MTYWQTNQTILGVFALQSPFQGLKCCLVGLLISFNMLSCCMIKFNPIRLNAFSVQRLTECFCRLTKFILLQPLWVTSSLKMSNPVPETTTQAQAMTLRPLCLFWIMRRSFLSSHFGRGDLFQNFYGSSLNFFVSFNLVWFLLTMRGLNLVICLINFCAWSLLHTVDCETFIPTSN